MISICVDRARIAMRTAVTMSSTATIANAAPITPAPPPAIRRSAKIRSTQASPKRTSSTNSYPSRRLATDSTVSGSRKPGRSRSSSDAGRGFTSRSANTSENSGSSRVASRRASVFET